MRRIAAIGVLVVVGAVAIYHFAFATSEVEPRLTVPAPVAAIGVGSGAVGVDSTGRVLAGWPAPEEGSLPLLPASEPPRSGQLRGPMLEQVRVLAAAPAGLSPYLASSSYGNGGVSVNLSSGIEIRFGDATQAGLKWRSAAAVLADPATE
ncbi:MAG TPA: cell division protein FtsQ/DivIB, partial [Solirubrobacterales bacterium]